MDNSRPQRISQFLRSELEVRLKSNPLYSLRAFARDLSIGVSTLSEVMNGKYGLSRKSCNKIGHRLGLSEKEIDYLVDISEAEFSRSRNKTQRIRFHIKNRLQAFRPIADEYFYIVKDWYHLAILELIHLSDFVFDEAWIGKKLGISPTLAKTAMDRLINVGLLVMDDKGFVTQSNANLATDDVPSSSRKEHHKQLMEKSIEALYSKATSEREFNSLIIAFDKNRMKEAKLRILEFMIQMSEEFGNASPSKNSVYCLSTQFVELTEDKNIGGNA